MTCEIELTQFTGIKPSLSIRIPPEPENGYWEDEPFTDDEEDEEDEPSLEELHAFLDKCPNVRGQVVGDGDVFRLWGPAKELDWLEMQPFFFKKLAPAIRLAFDVKIVEVGNDE